MYKVSISQSGGKLYFAVVKRLEANIAIIGNFVFIAKNSVGP